MVPEVSIGAFITITNPIVRGDMFDECYEMARECFDQVHIVDGEETWPREFSWEIIGKHFQKGYDNLDTDWVFHLDCDFFFHENDFEALRNVCRLENEQAALSFYKKQFILPHRYSIKSRLVLGVNKRKFGDRIKFNSGGDLAQPSLDGNYISPTDAHYTKIPFYNYEKMAKTEFQIRDDVERMARAWTRYFGDTKLGTTESAYDKWYEMVRGRYNKPHNDVSLDSHPKFVKETILNLTPDHFGYNGFGLEEPGYVHST